MIFPSGTAATANFPQAVKSTQAEIISRVSAALQAGEQVMMSTGGSAVDPLAGSHVYVVTAIRGGDVSFINPLNGKTIEMAIGLWFDDEVARFMICN